MIRRQDPTKGERSTETPDRERGAPLIAMSSCRHNDTPAEGFPFAARRNPRRGKTACDTDTNSGPGCSLGCRQTADLVRGWDKYGRRNELKPYSI